MGRAATYLELKLTPSSELIPIVRRFVSAFYERLLGQADVASRMALAAHELLENSCKYASDGLSSLRLGVSPVDDGTEVSVRTSNRASERDRENVAAALAEIAEAGDAFEHYQQVMRRSARRSEGSGLGLARICAEAEMVLSCAIAGDEVTLLARATLPGAPRLAAPDLLEVSSATFAASSTLEGRTLRVRLSGNADLGARSALETLLPRVHAEAQRLKLQDVAIDFTGLEFMSSSCFRSFVTWLSDVQDLAPSEQYRIRLVSHSSMLWQRRSLHALKCFADELVRIETA